MVMELLVAAILFTSHVAAPTKAAAAIATAMAAVADAELTSMKGAAVRQGHRTALGDTLGSTLSLLVEPRHTSSVGLPL